MDGHVTTKLVLVPMLPHVQLVSVMLIEPSHSTELIMLLKKLPLETDVNKLQTTKNVNGLLEVVILLPHVL